MTRIDIALCSAFSLCLPVGQIFFKLAANNAIHGQGNYFQKALTNPPLYGALGWYAMTAGFWYLILTRLPLSTAYVFSIAGAGLVPVAAWLVFREPVTARYAVGFAIMLIGFFVAVSSTR